MSFDWQLGLRSLFGGVAKAQRRGSSRSRCDHAAFGVDWRRFSALAVVAGLGISGASPTPAAAEEKADPAGIEFFEKHIRPVLAAKCFECHQKSLQARGGLRLDTREGVRLGGQSGVAIVPGDPTQGTLMEALRWEGLEMPPKKKLPDEVIAKFEQWIKMGAPDPRKTEAATLAASTIDVAEGRKHWSYQPPQAHPAPAVKDAAWPQTNIDRFVLAKLEGAGLQPGPEADAATWLRRVTFDLSGLPPTPEELAAFEKDPSPYARAAIVDRLLASPRFGERWGRHWLDVARYAESTGKERNFVYLQAYKYRDYVIDAFNQDKPFDAFLREQVAGDLLPHETPEERDRLIVATGFLALGPKGINERNREQYLLDIVDEQIDNVTRGVLATSVSCARCHDHKFDPIPTTDYYGLAGIFRSSETKAGIINRIQTTNESEHLIALASVSTSEATKAKIAELDKLQKAWLDTRREVRRLRNEAPPPPTPPVGAAVVLASAEAQAVAVGTGEASPAGVTVAAAEPAKEPEKKAKKAAKKPAAVGTGEASAGDAAVASAEPVNEHERKIKETQKKLQELARQADVVRLEIAAETVRTLAIGVVEGAEPADVPVRIRGEVDQLGPPAPRGIPQVLASASAPKFGGSGSGRLELAQWLASKENPLTARVIVNRVWQKLLGEGIVATVDDFGTQGEAPTHAELLDTLAVQFVEQGWSVKRLIREVALSRVYWLGAAGTARGAEIDPENKLLWKARRKRLEGEALRDAVLAVGGQLEAVRPTSNPVVELGLREMGPNVDFAPVQRPSPLRSVYLPVLRGQTNEMLTLFDMADPSLIVGKRDVTSGPTQALFLMNSPLVHEQGERFARRVLEKAAADDAARVDYAFRLALARPATAAERKRALQFVQEYAESAGEVLPGEAARDAAWTAFCQTLFAAPEFRYLF